MTSEADTDVDALKRGWRTNPPQRLSYNKQYFLSVQGTRQCFAYISIVVKQFAANEMKVLSALAVSFCPTFPFAMVSVRQVRYGKAVTE